jgi:hypothetical protein
MALNEEFERSGLVAAEFARNRGLNPSTFSWWRSQLRKQVQPAFLEVVVERPVVRPLIIRVEGRPFFLEVPGQVDVAELRRVLDALC